MRVLAKISLPALVVGWAALAGCVAGGVLKAPLALAAAATRHGGQFQMQVAIAPHANQDSPIAVDLLFVTNKALLKQLAGWNAATWFQNRREVIAAQRSTLTAFSWEWVPGQHPNIIRINFSGSVQGAIVFADYYTPGPHRAVFDPHHPAQLTLLAHDLQLVTAG